VVWDADYFPFGEANVNPNSNVVNNFRFAGQYFDAETGLHYNYHRYYNPATGRYLTPDPIGLTGGTNLYAYANLNPITSTDPFGLLVDVVFNKATGGLYLRDRDTGKTLLTTAKSGHIEYGGPIPEGKWEILERAGDPDYWRLDALDTKPRNDIHDPTGRNEFRFHRPGGTIGCVALDEWKSWNQIKKLLNSTKTEVSNDNAVPFYKPWAKNILKYGDLIVIDVPIYSTGVPK